ncbi:MAG: AAA family ATPase, partial [Patescibacteria group bacterium]
MYLKELSLQGFKTFAKATTLRFPDPKESRHAITAIVGPNGSGKSNIADAIRWVLGEQSIKTLRGKTSEDVIFSGSDGKTRSGFAEVTLTFADVSGIEGIEFSELTVSRRLYRDGESLYEVNGQSARLIDIQMLLAQANVGQKSYSVVGQGQVDHILAASPEERKSFFDDATGVKPLQLKRHQSLLKIHRTEENLTQAELLVQELTPRLTTLRRLTKRLGEREEIEAELRRVSISFYGSLWHTHSSELSREKEILKTIEAELQTEREILSAEKIKFENIEKEEKTEDNGVYGLTILQRRYDELQEKRESAREELFELKKNAEVSAAQEISWTPLPFQKILEAVEGLFKRLTIIKSKLKSGELSEKDIDDTLDESEELLGRLKKPTPEAKKIDAATLQKQKELEEEDELAQNTYSIIV